MKPSRRVTSKQVAERAGVSQTTVSFVLNNVTDANISEETKERVLRVAHELNYIPDVAARSLARGRSDNIALILAQPHRQVFIDEYIPRVLTGISEVTRAHGYRILVEQVMEHSASTIYRRLLQSREVAGVIVNYGNFTDQDVQHIITSTRDGMPVVTLNHQHPEVHSVEVDKLSGVRTIVQHLIDLGHRQIACIPYDIPANNTHLGHRLQIFREVMAENHLPVNDALIRAGSFDPETGYTAMQQILNTGEPFDAVYAMNDLMAFGAVRALRERGLRVPEDIAIVGFDDVRLAAFCDPPLTTINEPDDDHGRQAALMLMALLNGKEVEERHVTLHTKLIVRESCGAHLKEK